MYACNESITQVQVYKLRNSHRKKQKQKKKKLFSITSICRERCMVKL